jgi:hypothetical protein
MVLILIRIFCVKSNQPLMYGVYKIYILVLTITHNTVSNFLVQTDIIRVFFDSDVF